MNWLLLRVPAPVECARLRECLFPPVERDKQHTATRECRPEPSRHPCPSSVPPRGEARGWPWEQDAGQCRRSNDQERIRPMICRQGPWLVCLLACAGARGGAPPEPPKPTSHTVRQVEGWTVRVDDRLLSPPDRELGTRALSFLQSKLSDIKAVVGPGPLARLPGRDHRARPEPRQAAQSSIIPAPIGCGTMAIPPNSSSACISPKRPTWRLRETSTSSHGLSSTNSPTPTTTRSSDSKTTHCSSL